MAWVEVALLGGAGEAVPRADDLAVIAAEYPIADQWAQFGGDRTFEFDGQVGNAAPRIQHIGADEGGGGADIQARAATAAMFGAVGVVDGQRQVDEQLAEKEIAARLTVQHQGVFANPAQAGLPGNGFLQNRRAIEKGAVAERADGLLDALR